MSGGHPLHEAVSGYLQKGMARFHMPGHKGRGEGDFAPMLRWDITEVAGVDSLFQADGPILALEERLAKLYGTDRTLLSAGGATLCIQSMLALACRPGGKVILSRNIHRAALGALALLDLQPVWIYPDGSAGEWFLGRYTPKVVADALRAHPDAQAVYLTSPDYFGVLSDIAGVAAVCKGTPLLVDNAHGAHLPFLSVPYRHPIACGAALTADSLHKTMPAMTGGALLQIGDERFVAEAKRLMSLFGSTSPSYPILLSCEDALIYGETVAKAEFARTMARMAELHVKAREAGFLMPQGLCDPMKLVLGFGQMAYDAETFGRVLRDSGIEPEYVSGTAAVLMANGQNAEEDFQKVERMVRGVNQTAGSARPSWNTNMLPRPEQVLTPREATFAPQEEVAVENCVGRVVAGECSPCPPGIPIVMAGERIDEQTQQALRQYGMTRVRVVR